MEDEEDDDEAEDTGGGSEVAEGSGCDTVRVVPGAADAGGDEAFGAAEDRRWCGCKSCARVDTGLSGVTSAFATVGNLYAIHQPSL